MVDVSTSESEQIKSIHYWQKYLSTRVNFEQLSKTFSLILVGTKQDKIQSEQFSKVQQLLLNFLEKKQVNDLHFTSGLQHENVRELRTKVLEHAKKILESASRMYIPRFYKQVADKLKEITTTGTVWISLSDLSNQFGVELDRMNACLTFLHNIGVVSFHQSSSLVCIYPELLAKAMAPFVAAKEHLPKTLNKHKDKAGVSVLLYEDVKEIVIESIKTQYNMKEITQEIVAIQLID